MRGSCIGLIGRLRVGHRLGGLRIGRGFLAMLAVWEEVLSAAEGVEGVACVAVRAVRVVSRCMRFVLLGSLRFMRRRWPRASRRSLRRVCLGMNLSVERFLEPPRQCSKVSLPEWSR